MKQLAQSLADTFGVTVGYTTATGARKRVTPTMKLNIEVTDTFGMEANYSWVKRYNIDIPETTSRGSVVRRVKKHIGWTGVRCVVADYGDMIEIRPQGVCQVCFVTFS